MHQEIMNLMLLLFTIMIWGLYVLVYLSSPHNQVNQWICICGLTLSLGVFKEYLYYSGLFDGMQVVIFDITYQMDELVNSVLTAVLYYLSMPFVMIFSMYFCHLPQKRPRLFAAAIPLVFLPVIIFSLIYPWSRTREVPIEHPGAFTVVAIYNLAYGLIATVPVLVTLLKERDIAAFEQRAMVPFICLLPLWYWLITVFLFRLLKLEALYGAWRGNAIIVTVLFFYYVRRLFRDGIWGLRLYRERFDWQEESSGRPDNFSFVLHMLKNETAKLSWCVGSIRDADGGEPCRELDIMEHSIHNLEEFIRRTNLYRETFQLDKENTDIGELFRIVAEEIGAFWKGEIKWSVAKDAPHLYCDAGYMKEVLYNLATNAVDAMPSGGY